MREKSRGHGDKERCTPCGPVPTERSPMELRSLLWEALQEGVTHLESWDWSVPYR